MAVVATRDPAAYRRARRTAAIERHNQITKCYEEHQPPQVLHGLAMQHCMGYMDVLPRCVRGPSCLTAFDELTALVAVA